MASSPQQYRGSYLVPAFEHATVADVMRPGVVSCPPDASLTSVAQMMATHHIHAVVVGALSGQLAWGVISDMDLVTAAREGIEGRIADELIKRPPVTVDPTASLKQAAELMHRHGVAHLVVADAGMAVGIVSTLDLAGALAWGRA